MKILYVISELTFGGAQKQLVELARELVRIGHEVMVYTLNADVPRLSELDGSGVVVLVDQKRSRLDFRVLARLRRQIQTWKPDVVHGFLYDGDFYSRVASVLTGVPVLNSERSHGYSLTPAQKVGHLLTRHLADGIVANSHAGAEFARRLYRFPSYRVHVVWNGIRLADVVQETGAEAGPMKKEVFGDERVKVACLVGAIKEAKDYLLALDVADALLRKDEYWRVMFIGDQLKPASEYARREHTDTSEYKEAVMKKYMGMESRHRIKFVGLRTDVLRLVSRCDVLFCTSAHEGFPNVVLEAMAAGTPVVSTEYSDVRRILPLEWQVVADRSAATLASRIIEASAHRDEVAATQRSWVEANATIEAAAVNMEQVYRGYLRNASITPGMAQAGTKAVLHR